MKKLFPHIFVFLSFLLLIYLGTWQVQRLQYKNDLMAKIDSRINTAPITIDQFTNVENDEFRKMTVSGQYLHDKEILLLNKGLNGKQGQHVLTPLKLDEQKIIMVDRGWIAPDKDPTRFEETVTITGIIRAPQKLNSIGKMVAMENDPSKEIWFWFELPAMEKALGIPANSFYLDLVDTAPKSKNTTYPIALPQEIKLYNEHLQYAITWYSLSIALLIIYYFRFFRKK